MADLPDRAKHESALTAAVLACFDDERRRLGRGDLFVQERMRAQVRADVTPLLADTFQDAAVQQAGEQDWDLSSSPLELDAQRWGAGRAGELATQVAATTQEALAQPGADPQIIFGRPRAEGIGVTETTTAITAGDDWAAAYAMVFLFGEEDRLEEYWDASLDSHVCPVCTRLHGRTKRYWSREFPDGPPAHPNCRCRKKFVHKSMAA